MADKRFNCLSWLGTGQVLDLYVTKIYYQQYYTVHHHHHHQDFSGGVTGVKFMDMATVHTHISHEHTSPAHDQAVVNYLHAYRIFFSIHIYTCRPPISHTHTRMQGLFKYAQTNRPLPCVYTHLPTLLSHTVTTYRLLQVYTNTHTELHTHGCLCVCCYNGGCSKKTVSM